MTQDFSTELLNNINGCLRAAYELSVGQIYPYDNAPLSHRLKLSSMKSMVDGRWGTTSLAVGIFVFSPHSAARRGDLRR
jgi:phosphoketolase